MKNYDFSSIAAYMADVVCAQHGVPGCDMLIRREHETLYRHLCGYSSREDKTPLTENHLYYMYSCTKPLTVTAGMRLYEEGKLDLDAQVGNYLPAFRDVFLMKDGKKTVPVHPLTVRNLFTMTGGFDYAMHNEFTDAVIRENPHAGTVELVNAFARRPLCFEPGDHFQYSVCHDILAAVIETVSGMPFAEYLDEIMFTPLGMKDSTFNDTEDVKARLAGQYSCDGRTHEIKYAGPNNGFRLTDRYESGGAGLITTVADYAKFADTMACEGRTADGYRLLKPETVALLHTEQLHTFVMNNTFSCAAGPGYGYGLGVRTRINQDEGQRSPIGEFGWDGAAGAYVMMDPVNHLSITFGMHVLNWPACIGPDHAVMRDMIYDILEL